MTDEAKLNDGPLVELSVSGVSFTLRKKSLTDNDWMLAKIAENEIPWALYHNGKYFIDADPDSFRWVLHFTRYQTLPAHIRSSVGELETVRSLADFLCFEPFINYLDDAIASCVEIQSEVEKLQQEISKLKTDHAKLETDHAKEMVSRHRAQANEMDKLRSTISLLQKMAEKLDEKDGVRFMCCQSVVLWPASRLSVERNGVVCPCCKAPGRQKVDLIGNRGKATPSSQFF